MLFGRILRIFCPSHTLSTAFNLDIDRHNQIIKVVTIT